MMGVQVDGQAGGEETVFCLLTAKAAQTTGRTPADVAIFDWLFSEAGTQVQAKVAGAEAPWCCLSSNSGVVAKVTYTGREGALWVRGRPDSKAVVPLGRLKPASKGAARKMISFG